MPSLAGLASREDLPSPLRRSTQMAVDDSASPVASGCRFTTRVRLRMMKRPEGSAPFPVEDFAT